MTVRGGSGAGLAFQLAPDHVAPTWPDNTIPQQFHLDLDVPDLDEAERRAIAIGAVPTGMPTSESSFPRLPGSVRASVLPMPGVRCASLIHGELAAGIRSTVPRTVVSRVAA